MSGFTRIDRSVVGQWWISVDRWTLLTLMLVIAVGVLLTLAASPPAAARIGVEPFHFVRRHLIMLPLAVATLLAVSMLTPNQVLRLSALVLAGALAATVLTLVAGAEIKGARRWIDLGGLSVQPTEFLKPAMAVVAAWLFSRADAGARTPGRALSAGLYVLALALIMAQPDLGMAAVVSVVWFGQFFLAGLPLGLIAVFVALAGAMIVGAYNGFDHVQSRIDRFFDPQSGDTYQVDTSLQAFANGGLFGRGPGEGTVKALLPDAQSDFIFAVAGEEYGLLASLLIVGLFAFVVLRGFSRLMTGSSLFVLLAGAGLLTQYGVQTLINMASTLRLIPTKGMTLPFISYGGSSLVAVAMGMGMALALTRVNADRGAQS